MITTTDPREVATRLGVTIVEHAGGEKGRYHGRGVISLRDDLGPIAARSTLAHELAHYVLEHDPAATGWIRARQERRADQWAADLLIAADAYRAAEQIHGPHAGAIAAHLEVTVHLVETWRTHNEGNSHATETHNEGRHRPLARSVARPRR